MRACVPWAILMVSAPTPIQGHSGKFSKNV
jgi:hypothetical protein